MTDERDGPSDDADGNPAGDRDGAAGASGAERLTAPDDGSRAPRLPFPVVGIGASAGGLEAFAEFLDAMPPDGGMAFVLVQHLPPERESLIVGILAKHTAMPVLEVEDGQPVEANAVYVIRPGHTLTLADGKLRLGPVLEARGHSRPVDDFFRSLAEEQQQRAVAVVFSGMGSNGTAGAEAVKTVGGVCVAQDPTTAKFSSMPRSLIDQNLADYVLRPAEVPGVLLRYASHPYARTDATADAPARQQAQALADILAVLKARTRYDFTGYRKPTLLRRVQRRMSLTEMEEMADYAQSLRKATGEVTALADDLLIHVTGFFRDPEAWETLRTHVIEPLAADRPDGSPVRAWVTACATGEEAYTLAMLLTEAAEARGKSFDIKLFATDMAERALAHARAGVFPGGIESEVTPERLERFFDKDDANYRVKRSLRELVVFAPQNVLHDPPFSRLDIVTCRNLLIYLEPDAQRRVLALLHFSLREGGTLMLGSSETTGADGNDAFVAIDKKHRLFRRVGPTRHGAVDFPLPHALRTPPPAALEPRQPPSRVVLAQAVTQALLNRHTPAAVATDAAGHIAYFHGDTGRYLDQPRGEPTRDVLVLANEHVRGAVRTALRAAVSEHRAAASWDGIVATPLGLQRVLVGAAPLDLKAAPPHYLVTFSEHPATGPATDTTPHGAAEGADEADIRRARDELQGTLEELQTANEEMRASNEEVVSINEELQSANEELETSKEEMQSLYEELTTVNAQLVAKMEELEGTTNDFTSLLYSTNIAVLFLDRRFRIRRYTPAATDLFDLIPSDVGRPVRDLRGKFADPDLMADAQEVLDRLGTVEREVGSESGRWYVRRVLPYRTADDRIDGVVVTFLDVTAQRVSEQRLKLALVAARMGIWTLDVARQVHLRDANLNRLLGLDPVETVQPFADFLGRVHPDDRPAVAAEFADSVRRGRRLTAEFRVLWPDGTTRWLRDQGDVYPLGAPGGPHMTGACVDVTERREAQQALRASEERLRGIVESATDYAILTLDPDRTLTSWSPGAAIIFGYLAEEAVGQSGDVLFTPEDRAEGAPQAEAEGARRDGRSADERWHLRKDGTRFYASGVLTRLGEGGQGFVKVARDLTDRKRMDDVLRDARVELEGRVADRTAELSAAIDALEAEIARRRTLAQRLSTAQEDERRRVSRDLHDTVGQSHAALSLALRAALDAPPADVAARVAYARKLADGMGRELHDAAVQLRPTALDDIGLEAAVGELVRVWSDAQGVRGKIFVDLGDVRLPPEVETALFRVVQEALTNVAKHARAKSVSVAINRTDGGVAAVVEDDGVGFEPAVASGRLGLIGMQERVELLEGELAIESQPGAGTTVLVKIPI